MNSTLQDAKGIREQKRSLLSQIEIALSAAPTKSVTFILPNGGEYRVPCNYDALERFRVLVQTRFGKKFSYPSGRYEHGKMTTEIVYSPTDLNADYSKSLPGPAGIPPLNKAPTASEITETVSLFVSPDEYRESIRHVIKDGPFTVATGQHIMMVATGGEGEPIKTTQFPPHWRQVIPKVATLTDKITVTKTDRVRIDVDTAEMLHDIHSLRGIFEVDKGYPPAIAFYPNKTLSVRNDRMCGWDTKGEGQTGPIVGKPLFHFYASQMINILTAIRQLGIQVVSFYFATVNDPVVIVETGKTSRFVVIAMPIRAS